MTGNVFLTSAIDEKIGLLEAQVHRTLLGDTFAIPKTPDRDIQILERGRHPGKKGLSYVEGQARLLHDMANIELQAMELALRTLCEYPEADKTFRQQLADLTLSEGRHLKMCVDGLRELGYKWGHWPIHLVLWNAVDASDSLIDRIFIVHRYLEGSGLDAGQSLIERFKAIPPNKAVDIMNVISNEELDHVQFGSEWYRHFCRKSKLDADHKFKSLLTDLLPRLPKRMEPVNVELRKKALFSESEIKDLVHLRESQL
tara:strand:- start:83519 stop:84289 length:771 start_codon:yes stop_codon:yes gene_type:complete